MAVLTHWHDSIAAKRILVQVGDDKPVYTLRHTNAEADLATRAAQAKLDTLQRGTATLNLTLVGNAELMAEGKLLINGLRDGVDGEWLTQRVERQLDNQGFVTRIEAETPKY
jgi:phage protein D